MDNRTIQLTAQALKTLFYEPFGSKKGGRYRISRESLKKLLGVVILTDTTISTLQAELLSLGFVMTNLDSDFAILDIKTMLGYRKVPEKLLSDILH